MSTSMQVVGLFVLMVAWTGILLVAFHRWGRWALELTQAVADQRVAEANRDAKRWEDLAEDRREYIASLEQSLRTLRAESWERQDDVTDDQVDEVKRRMANLSAQVIENQEQLIGFLRAQIRAMETRIAVSERLAHAHAETASERQSRIFALEVQAEVDKGVIAQLRVRLGELEKQLDQTTPETA
jgi:chromosome segregation ATPase